MSELVRMRITPKVLLCILTAACVVVAMSPPAEAGDDPDVMFNHVDDIPGTDIIGQPNPLTGGLGAGDQHDVFAVPLEAGDVLIATLQGDPGTDFDMALFDPFAANVNDFGHIVDSDYTVTYPDSIYYQALDDFHRFGSHQLDLYAAVGLGNWTLDWQIITNDSLIGNNPPPSITGLNGRLELFNDENDAFRVWLEDGWRLVTSLDPVGSAYDPDLYLLAPGTTNIDSAGIARSQLGPGQTERIDYTATAVGDYYVNPWAGNFGTGGNYTLYHTVLYELAGDDRYATCAEVVDSIWQVWNTDRVVIATGRNWPDALGGAAVAGAYGCPILIVDTHSVPADILQALRNQNPAHAIILGGRDVVGAEIEGVLASEGITFERLAGDTRYDTAELAARHAVANTLWYDGTAFIATGLKFPDALSASPISAKMAYPIFLEGPNGLSASTLQAMQDIGVTQVVLLGQSDVVSTATENQMRALYGAANVTRLGGDDRYETGLDVVTWSLGAPAWMDPEIIAVATGENFPDALSGGPVQAQLNGPLMLTRSGELSLPTKGFLNQRSGECHTLTYLGGTDVVTPAVRNTVANVLGRP